MLSIKHRTLKEAATSLESGMVIAREYTVELSSCESGMAVLSKINYYFSKFAFGRAYLCEIPCPSHDGSSTDLCYQLFADQSAWEYLEINQFKQFELQLKRYIHEEHELSLLNRQKMA